MTPQSKNRLLAIGSLAVAGLALAAIAFGNIGENLVYYWTPGELLSQGDKAYGPTIRLGGMVKAGTISWNPERTKLEFMVADSKDPHAASVKVGCEQVPPQMFRENIGVVVEGTFDKSQVFKTQRLMVNHSNEYRPPKEGESTKEWQQSLVQDEKS